MSLNKILDLRKLQYRLNSWLKPHENSASWDNVGLLVATEQEDSIIRRVLITNDLTPAVAHEASNLNTNLIVTYHPLIFRELRTVAFNSWQERVITSCIRNDISIYSPHTCLDAVPGGINDSFVTILGKLGKVRTVLPIIRKYEQCCPRIFLRESPNIIRKLLESFQTENVGYRFDVSKLDITDEGNLIGNVGLSISAKSAELLQEVIHQEPIEDNLREISYVTLDECRELDLRQPDNPGYYWQGDGRQVFLHSTVKVLDVIDAIKKELDLSYVQVAGLQPDMEVDSFGICVGSGASILAKSEARCLITGEMSHHEILSLITPVSAEDARNRKCVILLGHCNSERHYLKTLDKILRLILGSEIHGEIDVKMSQTDKFPLKLA